MSSQIVPYSGSDWQIFKFGEIEVRGKLDEHDDPIFLASDVCAACDIRNVSDALERLDDDEKAIIVSSENGVPVRHLVVNESGLYSLIGSSRKSQAKQVKRWINHEVLPAIRKHGAYVARPLTTGEMLVANAEAYLRLERQVNEMQAIQAQQALQIEDIHEELLDRDYYTILQWCQRQHIQHTPALRQMWGKAAKSASLARNIEIKDANEGAYNVGRYHKSVLLDVCVPKPKSHGQMSLLGGGK